MTKLLAVFSGFMPIMDGTPVSDLFATALKITLSPTGLGPRKIAVQFFRSDFRPVDISIDRLMADCVF